MMVPKLNDPTVAATTSRVEIEALPLKENLKKEDITEYKYYQSLFVANRYSFKPHIDGSVCHLSGIGSVR